MTDTSPEIERMVRERLMARSDEERFIMGAQMFDSAVTMIRASFPPGLSALEQKNKLFVRLYGTETIPPPCLRGNSSSCLKSSSPP